jgi:hypothetical protein
MLTMSLVSIGGAETSDTVNSQGRQERAHAEAVPASYHLGEQSA